MAKKISELNAILAAAIVGTDQFVMVDLSGNETKRINVSEAVLLFTYAHPNHSGDVTSVGDGAQTIGALKVTEGKIAGLAVTEGKIGSLAVTEGKIGSLAVTEGKIAARAATYAKIQAMATARVIGRLTAGSGDFEELTAVQLTAFINAATIALKGTVEKNTTAEMRAWTVDKYPDGASLIAAAAKQTLTDQANIAFDIDNGWNAKVTLAGNRTLDNPANGNEGAMGFIEVIQDATGSRTLTLGSNYKTAGGGGLTLTTDANAKDILFWAAVSSTEYVISNILDIS